MRLLKKEIYSLFHPDHFYKSIDTFIHYNCFSSLAATGELKIIYRLSKLPPFLLVS